MTDNTLHGSPDTASADVELWRMVKADRHIVCWQREIKEGVGWDACIALELRIEHNEQMYLTELYRDHVQFHNRVEALRRSLEPFGWTPAVDVRLKADRRQQP